MLTSLVNTHWFIGDGQSMDMMRDGWVVDVGGNRVGLVQIRSKKLST